MQAMLQNLELKCNEMTNNIAKNVTNQFISGLTDLQTYIVISKEKQQTLAFLSGC